MDIGVLFNSFRKIGSHEKVVEKKHPELDILSYNCHACGVSSTLEEHMHRESCRPVRGNYRHSLRIVQNSQN